MKIGLGLSLSSVQRRRTDPFAALMSTLGESSAQLIIHPLEYGSMFQDRAGTTPVTESGQLVGHVLDAGPGDFHATAISDAARGIFRDVGGFRYIEYNGVNTAYQTPVLPAPGVDKAQVFAGLRSDGSATRMLLELSVNAVGNSAIYLTSPEGSNAYRFLSAGSLSGTANVSLVEYPVSVGRVITGLGDISAPRSALRIGGLQRSESLTNQGTGNYNSAGAYRLHYGARAGTSLFFNGFHYATLGPITRFGTNATAAQIAAAEAYYTARTDL